MSQYQYRLPDLANERDARIIKHVFRNFITLPEAVHRLFFSGLSRDTSTKVLRRLVRQRYLTQFPLFANRIYLRLGLRAARRWSYPRSRTKPLGAQRLPYELGALHHTSMRPRTRKRLLPHELKRRLPWFPDSLMQWAYLWDRDTLGSIRVEPHCRPHTVVRKFGEQLYSYSAHEDLRVLIESRSFFIVCITATEDQARALRQEAAEQSLQVDLITDHYPELIRFT